MERSNWGMDSLLKQLQEYIKQDYYPMHMPGHKRNIKLLNEFNPYEIDLTEVDGVDNLHHANGIIKSCMQRIQQIYKSENSYLLINGSTVGILASIAACVNKKDRILLARNCHKAVYNAVILNELNPTYVYPQFDEQYNISGGISPKIIEEMLITYPDIRLVVITSPTYEGVVSNVKEIVEICHSFHVPIIVDEAHGAHFGLDSSLPSNSIEAGADIVIHSVHKTLPAMTQTAIMHVNGTIVDTKRIELFLGIYETSSPSYVLMTAIDECMRIILEQGEILFSSYQRRLQKFYEATKDLSHLHIIRREDYRNDSYTKYQVYDFDPSKIVISVKNTSISGSELARKLLQDYKIQVEMSSFDYALAMTSICDTDEGFQRLEQALIEIDQTLTKHNINIKRHIIPLHQGRLPYDAVQSEHEQIPISQANGRVVTKNIVIYPPGIPIVAAGEILTREVIDYLTYAHHTGLEVQGIDTILTGDESDHVNLYVSVVCL